MGSVYRNLEFNDAAREKILRGVNTLSDAVRVTMGPRGQNVLIERESGPPHLTKDGVTVAQSIDLRDRFENLGAQLVKEAAQRSAEIAGDGTTTSTVLAQFLYSEGLRMIAAGFEQAEICKGIQAAASLIIEEIGAAACPIENDSDIVHVGTISANGDLSIGELIARALSAVGRDGTVTVEEAKGFESSLEVVDGTQVARGYLSPYFITNSDKMLCELDNPYVVLINKTVSSVKELLPILERMHTEKRSALLVADDFDPEVLQALTVNKLKGVLNVCAIRAPEFGDARVHTFDDFSLLTSSPVITSALLEGGVSLSDIQIHSCKRVIVTKAHTTLVGCRANEVALRDRISALRQSLEDPALQGPEREVTQRRLSRLSGGVAVLRVGGSTEIELKERKDRVDDALHATQAAVEEGVVPGGGTALLRAARCLDRHLQKRNDSYACGLRIVRDACEAPLRQIVQNGGGAPDIVVEKVRRLRGSIGYDARNEKYCDLVENGIIDPAKVVKSALKHSAAVACSLLSIGAAITFDVQEAGPGGDGTEQSSLLL